MYVPFGAPPVPLVLANELAGHWHNWAFVTRGGVGVPTSREVDAELTGPGAAFEVAEESVHGMPMRVYKDRMRSLREIASLATLRGDDQTFVVHRDRRVGFSSFIAGCNSISSQLISSLGVRRGDRVAVLSANNLEWCLAFWAVVDVGAILVGLNGWWKADEVIFGLRDSGARVLVADRVRYERLSDRLTECPDLEAVYLVDIDPTALVSRGKVKPFGELMGEARLILESRDPGSRPSDDLGLPTIPIEEDDPAVIFYTSGTTGRPKGAVSTHRSMIANLQNTLYNLIAGVMINPEAGASIANGQPTALLTSPLFHVSGCHSGLVVGLAAGIKLVIPDGRFEPDKAMKLIQEERVSVWATVPTMVWRVVEHPDRHSFDLSSVRSVAYGGSPSSGELQRRIQETFPNVASMGNAYGLTESSSVATVNSGPDLLERPDSVGRPFPVVEIRIVDEHERETPAGVVGEVQIRGPIVMPGYWNNPDASAEVIQDGWLRSGDIGYLDDDGFLYITDRARDMIIRGGENVYCVEIENRLIEHPSVAEAAVIGVPHPTLGEEVKAVVRLEVGSEVRAEELRKWVGETLADFKIPAYIDFTEQVLPRNASGKLLKNVLRGEGDVSFAETF